MKTLCKECGEYYEENVLLKDSEELCSPKCHDKYYRQYPAVFTRKPPDEINLILDQLIENLEFKEIWELLKKATSKLNKCIDETDFDIHIFKFPGGAGLRYHYTFMYELVAMKVLMDIMSIYFRGMAFDCAQEAYIEELQQLLKDKW